MMKLITALKIQMKKVATLAVIYGKESVVIPYDLFEYILWYHTYIIIYMYV